MTTLTELRELEKKKVQSQGTEKSFARLAFRDALEA